MWTHSMHFHVHFSSDAMLSENHLINMYKEKLISIFQDIICFLPEDGQDYEMLMILLTL